MDGILRQEMTGTWQRPRVRVGRLNAHTELHKELEEPIYLGPRDSLLVVCGGCFLLYGNQRYFFRVPLLVFLAGQLAMFLSPALINCTTQKPKVVVAAWIVLCYECLTQ